MKNWKAYKRKKGDWQLYDLSKEVEEKEDLARGTSGGPQEARWNGRSGSRADPARRDL